MAYSPIMPPGSAYPNTGTVQNVTNLSTGATSGAVLEGLLKDVYLEGLNDTIFNDPSLYVLFESSGNVDFMGDRIVKAFKTQKAGGTGVISEGGQWVASVAAKGQKGYEQIRYLNAYFEITNTALRTAKEGAGSFISEASSSIKDLMDNTKMDMDWQLGQKVDAQLATFTSPSSSQNIVSGGTTYTLDGGGGFFLAQYIRAGMRVDIYADATPTGTSANTIKAVYVKAVDIAAGTVTLSAAEGVSLTASTKYRICPYGQKSGDGKRINSLFGLVNNTGTVWNLDRATNSFLKSYVYEPGNSAELDEELLMNFLTIIKYQYQANPNALICSPKDFLTYFSNRTGERHFNTTTALTWTGGVTGMGITVGDRTMMLTQLSSIPQGDLFGINTGDFKFATQTNGYEWVTGAGGSILQQKEASDVKFATAVNALNFICEDPGRQARIKGLAADFPNYTTAS